MGRKRGNTGFDALAALPWPLGLAMGIAGFLAVRYGLALWLSQHGSALGQGIAQHTDSALVPLAWIALIVCWIAALFSFLGARHRRRLLDTRTTLESLAGGWRQFELLVGEAFRRQGYSVGEIGLGGADGGSDLILRKDGQRTLVQCKQRKRQQVGVSVVREMYGLLAHHQAYGVKIGEQFLEIIQVAKGDGAARVSLNSWTAGVSPGNQRCHSSAHVRTAWSVLVQRTNRRTREPFPSCSQFPRCRGNAARLIHGLRH